MAIGIDDAIAQGLKIINKFIPDPAQAAVAEKELRESLLEWDKGQLAVNAVEASNASIFVSGWRPAIGWICAFAIAYQFVVVPLGSWLAAFFMAQVPQAPVLDESLWELVTAMLGMAGFRMYEKVKGVARS